MKQRFDKPSRLDVRLDRLFHSSSTSCRVWARGVGLSTPCSSGISVFKGEVMDDRRLSSGPKAASGVLGETQACPKSCLDVYVLFSESE